MNSSDIAPGYESSATEEWIARHDFFEAIAQQVRRPLDGALAVTDLLERQPLNPEAQAYLKTLAEQHQQLLRTLSEACDLARAEVGKLELAPKPVDLRPLMDDIQDAWRQRASQGGVALSVSYDGEDLTATVDAPRLSQVFDHLIERALKMTRRGGVEASLRARRQGAGVIIEGSVRDSGSPIAPDKLARIFEARVDPVEGTGMILCRRLVEAMNGTIRAENNVGAGSTISFDFMAAESEAAKDDRTDQNVGRTAHVLVVDDNATNRMVAEALCEMFDCTSESAEDGMQAVEAAKSGRFDLILMDIKMPRMDGVEATRTIRAMPGRPGAVPIIALTANADPDDAIAYIASGMSSVVEKPIKPDALLAAMNACLEGAEPAAGRAAA
jgi:two-component system, sensor histidine kinase